MSLLCTRLRWTLLLLLLFGVTPPVQAAASDAPSDDGCLKEAECRDHYQRAIGLYESGRYETALPEFQAAYQSRQMPWLLINIGRTLHRLGRLDEAITFYNRYEQAAPNSDPESIRKVREYKAQAEVLLSAKGGTTTPPSDKKPPIKIGSDSPGAPTPLYKKWWFWTAIGGGVVVILAIGIGAGVASANNGPSIPAGTTIYMPTF